MNKTNYWSRIQDVSPCFKNIRKTVSQLPYFHSILFSHPTLDSADDENANSGRRHRRRTRRTASHRLALAALDMMLLEGGSAVLLRLRHASGCSQ
jgi:hypothetical protein